MYTYLLPDQAADAPSEQPAEVRNRARSAPRKSLGQHFLNDRDVTRDIVDAVNAAKVDAVIEVGPGRGALTEGLSRQARRLVAVEVDGDLASGLRKRFGDESVKVLQADILKCSTPQLLCEAGLSTKAHFAVAGNLPYNAGAAIVRWFLEQSPPPAWAVVMLQQEVAETICAAPGRFSLLSVAVQVYAEPRILFSVPPEAFHPRPKVTSSVIRLDLLREPLIGISERKAFFQVLHAGFHSPRKRLRNSLASGLKREPADLDPLLAAAGIDPSSRPASLSIADWWALTRAVEV